MISDQCRSNIADRRSVSTQNLWYSDPPINIKTDLGFPQELPLRSEKFRKNLMPDTL